MDESNSIWRFSQIFTNAVCGVQAALISNTKAVSTWCLETAVNIKRLNACWPWRDCLVVGISICRKMI